MRILTLGSDQSWNQFFTKIWRLCFKNTADLQTHINEEDLNQLTLVFPTLKYNDGSVYSPLETYNIIVPQQEKIVKQTSDLFISLFFHAKLTPASTKQLFHFLLFHQQSPYQIHTDLLVEALKHDNHFCLMSLYDREKNEKIDYFKQRLLKDEDALYKRYKADLLEEINSKLSFFKAMGSIRNAIEWQDLLTELEGIALPTPPSSFRSSSFNHDLSTISEETQTELDQKNESLTNKEESLIYTCIIASLLFVNNTRNKQAARDIQQRLLRINRLPENPLTTKSMVRGSQFREPAQSDKPVEEKQQSSYPLNTQSETTATFFKPAKQETPPAKKHSKSQIHTVNNSALINRGIYTRSNSKKTFKLPTLQEHLRRTKSSTS